MNRLLLIACSALLLTACGGNPTTPPSAPITVAPTSQQQTERLRGTWAFTFTTDKAYTSTYKLRNINASTAISGDYYLDGVNDSGGLVVAGYNSTIGSFSLLDSGTDADLFYLFDFTAEGVVSGCLYLVQTAGNTVTFSRCYTATGTRTSLATAAVTTSGTKARPGSVAFTPSPAPTSLRQSFEQLRTRR